MNMAMSQVLYMYITTLINIAFNYDMQKESSIRKHVNINKELEIVTKLIELVSRFSNHGGPPTKHP